MSQQCSASTTHKQCASFSTLLSSSFSLVFSHAPSLPSLPPSLPSLALSFPHTSLLSTSLTPSYITSIAYEDRASKSSPALATVSLPVVGSSAKKPASFWAAFSE